MRYLGGKSEPGEHEAVGAGVVHTAWWIYVRTMRMMERRRRRELCDAWRAAQEMVVVGGQGSGAVGPQRWREGRRREKESCPDHKWPPGLVGVYVDQSALGSSSSRLLSSLPAAVYYSFVCGGLDQEEGVEVGAVAVAGAVAMGRLRAETGAPHRRTHRID